MDFDGANKSVRILHVVTYMGRGGLETTIMNYYRRMDRSKVQFDFLVHRDFEADYDKEILALGGKIYRLPRLLPWSRNYQRKLNEFFEEHKEYKIVHVHQDCLSSVILEAAKKHRVPVRIAHSHSSCQDKNIKYPIKMFYKRRILKTATDLFACGKEAGDWMFCKAPYKIISNAIDSKLYAYDENSREKMRETLGISPESFVIGHIGRFDPVKNHKFLLDIFAKIKKKEQRTVLLLIGGGRLCDKIKEKAGLLGIADSVVFTGVHNDIPDLMQAMDCFVLPSLYEGLPVSLIEAQVAGLPCIVSDRVPCECDKTGLVKRISLDKGPKFWAGQILMETGRKRTDTHEKIMSSGYDIGANAEWLQDYYLEQWKKHE